jgi:hypothetical protein
MGLYFVLALIVAALLISTAVGLAIGGVIRRRDTQIPREDDQS